MLRNLVNLGTFILYQPIHIFWGRDRERGETQTHVYRPKILSKQTWRAAGLSSSLCFIYSLASMLMIKWTSVWYLFCLTVAQDSHIPFWILPHPSSTDKATCSPTDFICLIRRYIEILESFTAKSKQPTRFQWIAFIEWFTERIAWPSISV